MCVYILTYEYTYILMGKVYEIRTLVFIGSVHIYLDMSNKLKKDNTMIYATFHQHMCMHIHREHWLSGDKVTEFWDSFT